MMTSEDHIVAAICFAELEERCLVYASPLNLLIHPRKKFSQPISLVCYTKTCEVIIFLGWSDPYVGAHNRMVVFSCCFSHCEIPGNMASNRGFGVDKERSLVSSNCCCVSRRVDVDSEGQVSTWENVLLAVRNTGRYLSYYNIFCFCCLYLLISVTT